MTTSSAIGGAEKERLEQRSHACGSLATISSGRLKQPLPEDADSRSVVDALGGASERGGM